MEDGLAITGRIVAAVWFAALLCLGGWLAWRSSGPSHHLVDASSPGRLFVVFYLLLYGVGSVGLVLGGESEGAGPGLAAYGLVAFGIGAAVAARLSGVPHGPAHGISIGPVQPLAVLALAAVGILALASIAFQAGLPFLTGDAVASRSSFAGLTFDVFRWLVPGAALLALGVALARDSRRDWVLAGIAVAAVLLLELLLASRALPFELAISALLLLWWAGRRLRRRAWVSLGAAALLLFMGVQLARVSGQVSFEREYSVTDFVVERTVNRVLLIGPRTLEVLVNTIPAEEPYFAGSTYARRIGPLLGQPPRQTLGYWIYERLFPTQPGGFAAPGVLGELWANAGPLLALAGMFGFGALAVALGHLLSSFGTGVADRVFAALLVVAFARTYATSLNGFIATVVAILLWRIAITLPSWPTWLRTRRYSAPSTGPNSSWARSRTTSS